MARNFDTQGKLVVIADTVSGAKRLWDHMVGKGASNVRAAEGILVSACGYPGDEEKDTEVKRTKAAKRKKTRGRKKTQRRRKTGR